MGDTPGYIERRLSFGGWKERHGSSLAEARYNARIFWRDRLAVAGLAVVVLIILIGIFAPWIAPYPDQGRGASVVADRLQAPSAQHVMGTDNFGRDVLSRVIYGARIPILVAVAVIGGCVIIGVPLGGIAGFYGGKVDEVIMRVTDVFLAFPGLLLAIALVAFLGASLRNAMIALVISWWPWYTRLVRSLAISLRNRPFVEAAGMFGVRRLTIVRRHILPAVVGPVIIQITVDLGAVILEAAGLSFIGLGAQPPTAEWGLMVSEGRKFILDQWWIATFPGLAIFVLVLAANLMGDGLRDVLDPRAKR
jgi:peptide/nickel transport system permease protein